MKVEQAWAQMPHTNNWATFGEAKLNFALALLFKVSRVIFN